MVRLADEERHEAERSSPQVPRSCVSCGWHGKPSFSSMKLEKECVGHSLQTGVSGRGELNHDKCNSTIFSFNFIIGEESW